MISKQQHSSSSSAVSTWSGLGVPHAVLGSLELADLSLLHLQGVCRNLGHSNT